MILGETIILRHSVSAAEPFQITGATYKIYNAEGTVVSDGLAGIVNDGTADQEVRAAFTPTETGDYQIVFAVETGGQVRLFPQEINVTAPPPGSSTFVGIVAWIRSRLQDVVLGLDNAVFTGDIQSQIDKLFTGLPVTYTQLSGANKRHADKAIGLWVAADFQVPASTGGMAAPVTYRNITTKDNARVTLQTAQVSNTSQGIDERRVWRAQAEEAWVQITFVADLRPREESGEPFLMMGGARRPTRTCRPDWRGRYG